MTSTGKPNLALLVQLEDEFGQARLKAYVMAVQPDGALHSTSWQGRFGYDEGSEYDGLEVSAYVGQTAYDQPLSEDSPYRGVWGINTYYAPRHVESVQHAQAIARVLGKLERGMNALRESDGYIRDGDLTTHVLRVARILKIGTIYVRQSQRARDMSGETYRKVTGASLQSWVECVSSDVQSGRKRDYVR